MTDGNIKVVDKRPHDLKVGDKTIEELGAKTIYLVVSTDGGVVGYESESNALSVVSVVGHEECTIMKIVLYPKIGSLLEN